MPTKNSATPGERAAPTVLFLSAVAVSICAVIGHHGLLQLLEINNEAEFLRKENAVMESSITELRNNIHDAEHDDFYLEKKAREELMLSGQDELIYVFADSENETTKVLENK